MDVHEHEANTGVRFSWNIWPPTRAEAQQIEVPLGCMYTPLKESNNLQLVEYEPIKCRVSGCILNPFCPVDFRSKCWTCPFSLQRNSFPVHYAQHISEQNLPAELLYPSIEYILPQQPSLPTPTPLFLLVVDICLISEEIEQLRDSLMQALALMPSDAVVGLITFGAMAMLHVLSNPMDVFKVHVFHGSKDLPAANIQQQLGFVGGSGNAYTFNRPEAPVHSAGWRFLQPVADCENKLNSILENLTKDFWPIPPDSRPHRCTGLAVSVAISLLESCWLYMPARILLFVGGVCTTGPGQVVDLPLAESIRHHLDLQKENSNARFVKKALKFYTSLANRAVKAGIAIDIFASSLDQVGLYEMKVMPEKTGGCMVMSDSFSINVFKESLKKYFETDSIGFLKMGFNARIEVFCSKEFKICGAIGPCTSTGKKGAQVSDQAVGEANTCEWQASSLDKESTIAFYFDVTNTQASNLPPGKQSFLQFQTVYVHPSGRRRLRVTTLSYRYADQALDIAPGFDQEAATVLLTRLAVFRTESEESLDILRWLDRKLIRLVARFADYQKDDPNSFHLSQEFSIYPQFMYHLRRSHFLQTFNASPDETAYYRSVLLRAKVLSALVMIQPALLEYSLNNQGPPQPVLLDAQALKPDVILLLDSFFHIVVWHGEVIHQWQQAEYHKMPEYENLRQLLQAPLDDAAVILDERFPVPKYVQCNSGGSQARFLLAKVNPSTNYSQTGGLGLAEGDIINTDDVSLKVFMEHLIKLAVQS